MLAVIEDVDGGRDEGARAGMEGSCHHCNNQKVKAMAVIAIPRYCSERAITAGRKRSPIPNARLDVLLITVVAALLAVMISAIKCSCRVRRSCKRIRKAFNVDSFL